MRGRWVYIITDKPYGTLYAGVTSDIRRRAWEHREGAVDGFTKQYGLKCLVYVEAHETIEAAIEREKRIKRWRPAWKIDLIQSTNPAWKDLYDTLNECNGFPARAANWRLGRDDVADKRHSGLARGPILSPQWDN